jgi:PAS domain S-box-containing protein
MTAARVLLVEDEAVLALGLQDRLHGLGHEVVGVASRADEACLLAQRKRPDLVLMDIRLEGKEDGIDAGRAIRSQLDVPVVYLSAYGDEETIARARDSEAFGYLHKPCHDRELRTAIELALRKHATERRHRDSARQYAEMLTSLGDGVLAINRDGRVTLLNPVAEQLTGWRRDEALGQPIEAVLPLRDEGTRQPRVSSALRALREDRVVTAEPGTTLVSRLGREFPIDDTAAPIREKGRPVGAVVSFRDQSARRAGESRLRQLQRLEALGVMAGGIARDFNNLLTPIVAYAGLLRGELPADSSGLAMLDQIEGAARRASEITRQVLAFSGDMPAAPRSLDLSALVKEVAGLLRSSDYSRAPLQLSLAAGLPALEADPDQLRQLVLNLLTNAVESLGPSPGGAAQVAVRTGRRRLSDEQLRGNATRERLRAGEYLFVEVTDTGCGMEPACLERVFEPFFTTKSAGRGLGLSAALGIVRGHHGALLVHSLPGRGSTFEALFPVCAKAAGLASEGTATSVRREGAGRRTALVVDDEEGIPRLLSHFLQPLGLEVVPADSGAAAVDLLRGLRGQVAVALVDLQMPGDDGPATIRKLRAIEPDLPAILLSGHATEEALARCQGLRLEGVMQKPFSLAELAGMIRKVLGARR